MVAMSTLGTSFGTAAADYESGRPTYPPDAVAWLLGTSPLRVADVGAGTGKLTREVVRQGHDVVAVDPDPGMLAALSLALPGIPTTVGSAEDLPLPDASVDAVTFGQAWHWVDVPTASAEVARVVRPGGTMGLIWNLRDESVPWVAALGEAMGASKAESMLSSDEVEVSLPWGPLAHFSIAWSNPVTIAELTAMVRSRSYYIVGDPSTRADIDDNVAHVLADVADVAPGATVPLPYVTHAFRTTRP